MNFLDELNDEQRKAAETLDGPVMIIAGAGSGKTRTLTYRIANILEHGVDPFRIMALTFTNKAAEEMKNRIVNLVGSKANHIFMGTFHSIFNRILHIEAEKIGFTRDFNIYDTSESKSLLKKIVKSKNLDIKLYSDSILHNRISSAKNSIISPEDYCNNQEIQTEDYRSKRPQIGEIYLAYNSQLHKANVMDFDDLLYYMYILLRDNPEIAKKYQERFQYVLVDEFQDTNHVQYQIIKKLTAKHRNICIVGDDAQSIYAFRGANIQNIYNFKADYPELKLLKLERNYRSCKNIIASANAVIKHNSKQIKKLIWTDNEIGDKICLNKSYSDNDEGKWIAQQIFTAKMKSSAVKYEDFAILYRMNMQSRAIEDALRQYNIPYRIRSGQSFYQRAEIKDVLAFFRIACNPKDVEAFERVLKLTDKIGATSIEKLYLLASTANISIFEVMSDTKMLSTMFNQNTAIRLKNIADCVAAWHSRIKTTDAFELACDILTISNIEKKLKDEGDSESEVRLQNIDALMSALKLFTVSEHQVMDEDTGEIIIADDSLRTLDEFVQTVVLLTNEDVEDEKGQKVDAVTLMTIHAAKGLEYPYVFIVGVEENIFPSLKSINTKDELEEERRLFYVAITRAMKNLFISFAKTRYLHGQFSFCEPSRFLDELDMDTLDKPNLLKEDNESNEKPDTNYNRFRQDFHKSPNKETLKPIERNFDNFKSLSNFKNVVNKNTTAFSVGQKVKHEKFGLGEVVEVTQNDRISVLFDEVGLKTLLLAFAKLELL